MYRFLYISFLTLALVIGVAGAAPVANAQATTTPTETSVQEANTGQNNSTTLAAQSQDSILDGIMMKIMSLFALLVGVAALLLDWTMYYTVVTMGNYVSNLTAVGVAWRILRDISNIALIFGFLAIGISIILETNWYGGGTKLLPKLLMAAVFLNFSLFFTEAVIDGGNLLATQFYTQINGGVPASKVSLSLTTVSNEGISNKIMSQLGLQSIYGDARNANTDIFKAGNPWLIGFMGILLFLITAFVLFSLAFILIARFVALIFIIILAPIGVIGFAVPQLSSIGNKWKDALIQQTITAPILLLMLYIALAVITDAQFLTGFDTGASGPSWLGFIDNGNIAGFAGMLLSFIVAMGLLLAVVVYAKKLSAFGASGAIKLAGKATFGATAFGASALVNTGALGVRKALQRYAPNSRTARVASNYLLRPLEKARMDVRSLPGISAGLKLGKAGEAAAPITKSALGSIRQGSELFRKTTQESNRQYDQETHIPRLRAAIAANNAGDINKFVGTMSDKELESNEMQKILVTKPAVVAALAQSRFDKLLASDALTDSQKSNLKKQREDGLKARYTDTTQYQKPSTSGTVSTPIPSVRHPEKNMSRGEQAVRSLTNEAASQLPDFVLSQPDVYENLSLKQLNAIFKVDKIKDETAVIIGTFLSTDNLFRAYFNVRNRQQQQDLNTFWHMNLPLTATSGEGTPLPPSGYQQNPGGNLFVRKPL